MRRKITSVLIIITLTLFLSNSLLVNASSNIFGKDESLTEIQNGVELENFNQLFEEGTTSTNGETRQDSASVDLQTQAASMPFLEKLLCRLLLALPQVINYTLSTIVGDGKKAFTIENLLTGEYDLFDIKYLIDSNGMDKYSKSLLEKIGTNTAGWFVGVRNLALAGSVITLIYIAIRLALATVSKDKSEYKKILLSWLEAVIILLVIQFLIVFLISASDFMVDKLKDTMEKTGAAETLEEQIMNNIDKNLDRAHQTSTTIFYTALYIMFSYYQVKFFVIYIGRLLRTAFYIIISPLVCLTYPIDKVGDGRAQGFNNWLQEFIITVFLQPIHLLIYLVMIYSMGEILIRNPILGLVFLATLSNGEKIFKSVMKIKPRMQRGLSDIKLGGGH